jgi:hypothetical protein
MPTQTFSEPLVHRVVTIDGELPDNAFSAANIEPDLVTAPEDLPVLKELMEREPLFHRAQFGTSRADLEKMVTPEFWETGASGRRYSRQFCIDTLEKKFRKIIKAVWEVREFQCLKIAQDNYLLTYTLVQPKRQPSRRATIWRRTEAGWQVVYHQATPIEGEKH